MQPKRPAPSTLAALSMLVVGATLLVVGLDFPPSSALAAEDTVIRIERGDVVRSVHIDEAEIERIFEEAFEGFDEAELERTLEQVFTGLDGLGDEIAAALEGLDIEFDADRGYGYHYRGHFDGEEFGRHMAEFGERMAERQGRIAERVQRAVERSQRRRVVHFDRSDRHEGDDDADHADRAARAEEHLRREIRQLERELNRLQRELEEIDALDDEAADEDSREDRR